MTLFDADAGKGAVVGFLGFLDALTVQTKTDENTPKSTLDAVFCNFDEWVRGCEF